MKFFKIKNNSNFDLSNSEELFHGLGQFAQKRFGFKKPPALNLVSDEKNAGKLLGKTAYYDPQSLAVTIYTDNRHAKDILRSLAHELVHHTQNENGMLNDSGYHGEGYAQKNKGLRKSEEDAYLRGNMCFRDWEDQLKQDKPTIYNEWRNKDMSTKDWKRKELMENLTEKFGFKMDLRKLNEGEIPAGLKKYQDEQKAKKGDSDEDEDSEESEEESEDKEVKPDFADIDKDGNKKEPMKKAAKEMTESRLRQIIRKLIVSEAKKKSKDLTESKQPLYARAKEEADKLVRALKGELTVEELKEKIKSFERVIKNTDIRIKNAEKLEGEKGKGREGEYGTTETIKAFKKKKELYEKLKAQAEEKIKKLTSKDDKGK